MSHIKISIEMVNKILSFLGNFPFSQVSQIIQELIADVEGQKVPQEKKEEVADDVK